MNQKSLDQMLQKCTRKLSNANRQQIIKLNRMKLFQDDQVEKNEKEKNNNRALSILVEKLETCQNKEDQINLFDQMNQLLKDQKQLTSNLIQKIVNIIEKLIFQNDYFLGQILQILETISKNYEDLITIFTNTLSIKKLFQVMQSNCQSFQYLQQFSYILRYLISQENSYQIKYKQYEYFSYLKPLYQIYIQVLFHSDKWESVAAYYKIIKGNDINNVIQYSKQQYHDQNGSVQLREQFDKVHQDIVDDIEFSIICMNEIAFELYQNNNHKDINFKDKLGLIICELYFFFKQNKDTQLSFLEFLCNFSINNEQSEIIDEILIQGKMLQELIEIIFDELAQSFFKKNALIILHNFNVIQPKFIQIWTQNEQKIEKLIQLYFESDGTTFQIDVLNLICQLSKNINFNQWKQLKKIGYDQILIQFFDHFYIKPNSPEMKSILKALYLLLQSDQEYHGDLNIRLSEGSFIEQLADLQQHVKNELTFQQIQDILTEHFEDFI